MRYILFRDSPPPSRHPYLETHFASLHTLVSFADTEIDWTAAREALKRARRQLDELDEETTGGAQDPTIFFEKV